MALVSPVLRAKGGHGGLNFSTVGAVGLAGRAGVRHLLGQQQAVPPLLAAAEEPAHGMLASPSGRMRGNRKAN